MADEPEFFVDLSVLLDYLEIYESDFQKCANVSLEYIKSEDALIIISKPTSDYLTELITDRFRLLRFLINRATGVLKEFDRDYVTEYKASTLNSSDISSELGLEIGERLQRHVDQLREHIDDVGLERFREELDEYIQKLHSSQTRLREYIISDTYSAVQDNLQAEIAFESIADTEIQAESLLDAVYWSQETGREEYLVSERDVIFRESGEINRYIANIYTTAMTLNIFSPQQFVEHYDIELN